LKLNLKHYHQSDFLLLVGWSNFKNEFDELGRQPNLFDVEEYFKMKIIVDDTITESEGYRLLTKAG